MPSSVFHKDLSPPTRVANSVYCMLPLSLNALKDLVSTNLHAAGLSGQLTKETAFLKHDLLSGTVPHTLAVSSFLQDSRAEL